MIQYSVCKNVHNSSIFRQDGGVSFVLLVNFFDHFCVFFSLLSPSDILVIVRMLLSWTFLHDDAFSAASRAFTLVVDVHLALWASGTEAASTRRVGRHLLVVSADFSYDIIKGIIDINT